GNSLFFTGYDNGCHAGSRQIIGSDVNGDGETSCCTKLVDNSSSSLKVPLLFVREITIIFDKISPTSNRLDEQQECIILNFASQPDKPKSCHENENANRRFYCYNSRKVYDLLE